MRAVFELPILWAPFSGVNPTGPVFRGPNPTRTVFNLAILWAPFLATNPVSPVSSARIPCAPVIIPARPDSVRNSLRLLPGRVAGQLEWGDHDDDELHAAKSFQSVAQRAQRAHQLHDSRALDENPATGARQ